MVTTFLTPFGYSGYNRTVLFADTKREAKKRIDVELDLYFEAKKPAETGREVAPGIFGWIKGWLWKLYEKTLKVVVEAILERLWPKSS